MMKDKEGNKTFAIKLRGSLAGQPCWRIEGESTYYSSPSEALRKLVRTEMQDPQRKGGQYVKVSFEPDPSQRLATINNMQKTIAEAYELLNRVSREVARWIDRENGLFSE